VTPQSFGGQLRKLREHRRVTLEVIEKKTKVSMSLLRSLENGGCEGWPGGIYSRGYVRAYAEAIGVDPEHVLAAFIECYPRFAPAALVEPTAQVEQKPQTPFEKVKAAFAGLFRAAGPPPSDQPSHEAAVAVATESEPVASLAPARRAKAGSGERGRASGNSAFAQAAADVAEAFAEARRGAKPLG
jgi:transcriptional regulator with XRE-family HTH domain